MSKEVQSSNEQLASAMRAAHEYIFRKGWEEDSPEWRRAQAICSMLTRAIYALPFDEPSAVEMQSATSKTVILAGQRWQVYKDEYRFYLKFCDGMWQPCLEFKHDGGLESTHLAQALFDSLPDETQPATSNERLGLSWRTYTLNKGFIVPEIYHVVKDAFTAAWHAGVAEPRSAAETNGRIGPTEPENDMVICPACTSQFKAIPVNVQDRIDRLEHVLRGFYWDQVDYLTRNKLGGMNNHWMGATRVVLGIDSDDDRPAVEPTRDDPNAPFRWICPKCTTVNAFEDNKCVGCGHEMHHYHATCQCADCKARHVGARMRAENGNGDV